MVFGTPTRAAVAATLVACLITATRGAPVHPAAAGAANLAIISLVEAARSGARSGTIVVGTIDEAGTAVLRIPARSKAKNQFLDLVRRYGNSEREILILAPTPSVANGRPVKLRLPDGETVRWSRVSNIVQENRGGLVGCENRRACTRLTDRSTAVKDGEDLLRDASELFSNPVDANDVEEFIDQQYRSRCGLIGPSTVDPQAPTFPVPKPGSAEREQVSALVQRRNDCTTTLVTLRFALFCRRSQTC